MRRAFNPQEVIDAISPFAAVAVGMMIERREIGVSEQTELALNDGTFATPGVGPANRLTLRDLCANVLRNMPNDHHLTLRDLHATTLRIMGIDVIWTPIRGAMGAVLDPVAIEGDPGSFVSPETIKELVAFAKADRRDDFLFLAGASGVPDDKRDELWSGTRARLRVAP